MPRRFLKKYLDKRLVELQMIVSVYLSVIDKPQTSVWYKEMPVG